MEWVVVKTLLSLAAVLGLMVAVLFVLKKFVFQSASSASSVVPVDILGQRSLHPKRSIVVVKVLNTVMVVGMSEQGMQTLATIEDEESLTAIEDRQSSQLPENRWMTWNIPGNLQGATSSRFATHLQDSIRAFLVRKPSTGRDAEIPGTKKSRRRS